MMREKLGLISANDEDSNIINTLELNMSMIETDMTIFFRTLSKIKVSDSPEDAFQKLEFSFYQISDLDRNQKKAWLDWLSQYINRLKGESQTDIERAEKMNAVNPKYVLRNYMAQLAIDAADQGDYSIIEELYQLLKHPYSEQLDQEKWFAKRPEWARHKVGCSMLSCSS